MQLGVVTVAGVDVADTWWPLLFSGTVTVVAKAVSDEGAGPSYGGKDVAIERTLYNEPGRAALDLMQGPFTLLLLLL